MSSSGWDAGDAGACSLLVCDIHPPFFATRHSSHTWVLPCTCARPSPTVCLRMPGPASSCATYCMLWGLTCWPTAACGALPSSYARFLAPQPTMRSSTEGAVGLPKILFTYPAGPAPGRGGLGFLEAGGVSLGAFGPGYGDFRVGWGGGPRSRCSSREGHGHAQLSPHPNSTLAPSRNLSIIPPHGSFQ